MITLFTGVPGAGKTASLVDLLRKIVGDRPLYVMGLNGLTLPHTEVDARDWHNVVPDGSIVVIDEVQQVWRPLGPGQKVPPDIAALETHRHRGIDFYVTTQNPKLVHANVRDLVGRHIHVRDVGLLGRWWYEWPECSTAVSWRTAPIKKKFSLPKSAFALYKSASIHVKPIRSFPMVIAVLVVAVVAGLGLAYYAYKKINAKLHPEAAVTAVPTGQTGKGGAGPRATALTTGTAITQSFTPRLADRPETAPAYDHLRVVVNMPRIVGGYSQAGQAHCFLQNGRTAPVSPEACAAWLLDPPFDPYYTAKVEASTQPYGAAAAPPERAASGPAPS